MKPASITVTAVLLILNLFSFFLMRHDKQCAIKNRRRIPEKTLFLSAALFGAFGATLGMFAFRHKTKHWYFRLFFPILLAAQIALLAFLFFSVCGGKL